MILKIGTDRQELKVNTVYIQDDPKLTLTNFTTRSGFLKFLFFFANTRYICPTSVYRPIGPLVYM